MNKKIALCLMIISLVLLGVSCYYDKEDYLYPCDESSPQGPLFKSAKKVIDSRCVGCHNDNRSAAGYSFSTPCSIVTNWAAINNSCVATDRMPEGQPLSAAEKDSIRSWIVNGNHQIGN